MTMGKEGAMQLGCCLPFQLKIRFSSAEPSCIRQPYLPLQEINGDINVQHRVLCHFIMETGSYDRFLGVSLDEVTF